MWRFPFRRSICLAGLVASVAACAEEEDYVQRYRRISIGMSEQRMAAICGPPWYEVLVFETGRARTSIHFHHGHVRSIYHEDDTGQRHSAVLVEGQTRLGRPEDAVFYDSSPVKLMMTHAAFDAVMKGRQQPTLDCRSYVGDARAEISVCFKNGRVVSKELKDVPPV